MPKCRLTRRVLELWNRNENNQVLLVCILGNIVRATAQR